MTMAAARALVLLALASAAAHPTVAAPAEANLRAAGSPAASEPQNPPADAQPAEASEAEAVEFALVRVRGRRASVTAAGRFSVRVGCGEGGARCAGRLETTSTRGGRALGSGALDVAPGASKRVALRVDRPPRRGLVLRVRVSAWVDGRFAAAGVLRLRRR